MTYDERVRAYEAEGMTRSDAQGIVDLEDMRATKRGDTMSAHTTGPFHLIQHETDEYPTHCKADARIIGADGLCYGILFGGEDSYPDVEKLRMAHAFIVRACNSHEAILEALKGLLENAPRPKGIKQDFHYILYREAARKAIRLAEGRG